MPRWTFITNHGAVLVAISQDECLTTRELANTLGITERSVIRIIKDLETAGYIIKHRIGRTNRYEINHNIGMRHETLRDIAVGELLKTLS